MTKNYSANVGITGFSYAKLLTDNKDGATYSEVVNVPFSQQISIETETSIEKAYGDDGVAEMATSTGSTSLSMEFHALPLEVQQDLLGLEVKDGVTIQKKQVTPPIVAISIYLNKADGSQEIVGLTKGMFSLPSTEASTKEDSLEFGNAAIEGEFYSRVFDDITKMAVEIKKGDEETKASFFKMLYAKEA